MMRVRDRLVYAATPLYRQPKPGARMRPGYLVVGTKRGGSTSLANWITQHPEVAPCRSEKGSHYFDTNYPRGKAWYAARFPRPAARWRITGEASPYYMFHPDAPRRIAKELPDAKLIAVLRDPVERAWSHYRYESQHGRETESFARALDLEPSRIAGERERLSRDPTYEGWEYRHHAYLERGHYADQLRELYDRFPREQVLVLKSEDMFADPGATLERVWHFLDLPDYSLTDLDVQNAGTSKGAIPEAQRCRLIDYYKPYNEALYAMVGIDFRQEGIEHE